MNTGCFLAGAARVDITPPLGTLINGDFVAHYARTIHDRLYSKALVMRDREQTIAIILVDICAMDKDLLDEVRQQIFRSTGIAAKNVMIASTHTHAAGSVVDLLLVAADLSYRKRLCGAIVDSLLRARENLRPARLAAGAVDAPEHVVCRRYLMKPGYEARNPVTDGLEKIKTNPSGDEAWIDRRTSTIDPELCFLAVQGMDSRWIALLGNYCLHYVGDWEPGTITSDYFGAFAERLSARLSAGEDFIGMMSNGTSGEANIMDYLRPGRYPTGSFEKTALIADQLAQKVATAMSDVRWEECPRLDVRFEELKVAVRKPLENELKDALKIVGETDFAGLVLRNSHTGNEDGFRRIYAREQVLLSRYPDSIYFPVQAMSIGPVVIGGLGGEFFSETGLQLKAAMGRHRYFTVCFANGYVGYVPPAHELAAGGYETWRCRTSFLEEGAEEKIRSALSRLAGSLRENAGSEE